MSAQWFGHKRIGYLAASLSFTKNTDVILLTTHLFRKGFNSQSGGQGGATAAAMSSEGFQYETGAAISCLANIVTPDLAQDLLADVYSLINSSRPYVRKKAVLVLLRIFHAWPKALRLSFDRLKEKLEDENQGVVSAAVYVICELAAKNPKNYLALAPQFFKILTTSSNNWSAERGAVDHEELPWSRNEAHGVLLFDRCMRVFPSGQGADQSGEAAGLAGSPGAALGEEADGASDRHHHHDSRQVSPVRGREHASVR